MSGSGAIGGALRRRAASGRDGGLAGHGRGEALRPLDHAVLRAFGLWFMSAVSWVALRVHLGCCLGVCSVYVTFSALWDVC